MRLGAGASATDKDRLEHQRDRSSPTSENVPTPFTISHLITSILLPVAVASTPSESHELFAPRLAHVPVPRISGHQSARPKCRQPNEEASAST
jgi:hypothetical protein